MPLRITTGGTTLAADVFDEAILIRQRELADILETCEETRHRQHNSTCSVQELRLPIFAPVTKYPSSSPTLIEFKKNRNKKVIATSWGEICISGKLLCQVHKDMIDTIIISAKSTQYVENGRLLLRFTIKDVLRKYGTSQGNSKWFKMIMEDILNSTIKLVSKDGRSYYFHIIDTMYFDENNQFGGITLSPEYLRFFQETLAINYNSEVKRIIAIKNAFIKAIVRFFISHNYINISFTKLLAVLCINTKPGERYYRKLRQEVEEHRELLLGFGIEYILAAEVFLYRGNKSVKFIPRAK